MKAISVRQPWAWLIVHGYKDIENRSWPTGYRGSVLIHASKTLDPSYDDIRADIWAEGGDIPDRRAIERGGIVGQATIVDCIDAPSHKRDDWFWGPYGFVLENARPLPFHTVAGKLKFFDVDLPADFDREREQ